MHRPGRPGDDAGMAAAKQRQEALHRRRQGSHQRILWGSGTKTDSRLSGLLDRG